jgi:hypothetical protein
MRKDRNLFSQLPALRGHYKSRKRHKCDAGALILRNWGIPEMLQLSGNRGSGAYRASMGWFFFWGQPFRHLFHSI